MKLMTDALRAILPTLYETEREADPLVHAKYFTPWTSWTWYVIEFDGDDTFFGLVKGFETELGYFSLSELVNACGPGGLRVERDLYFSATRLSVIMGRES